MNYDKLNPDREWEESEVSDYVTKLQQHASKASKSVSGIPSSEAEASGGNVDDKNNKLESEINEEAMVENTSCEADETETYESETDESESDEPDADNIRKRPSS
eukprot:12339123-Karenia_brevis.AAC.1